MPCPTCDHTMQRLSAATIHGDYAAFYCPRCGTLVEDGGKDDPRPPVASVPALVTRCREFEQAMKNPATGAVGANLRLLWHTEGIGEAIHRPEDRK